MGFSEKEAAVYLASLELGPGAIQEIARKSQISRSTAYAVIESLAKKGLMSVLTKGTKRYFSAVEPEKLMALIDVKQKELAIRREELKSVLPDLRNLAELTRGRPKIKFYDGKQGIRKIQDDILKTKNLGTVEEFVPLDDAYQLFPSHSRDHRYEMGKRISAPERIIYTSKRGEILPKKKGPIEARFISPEKFPFKTEITIYANKTAMVSFGRNLTGMILENEDTANTLRCIFNLLWQTLKK